MPWGISQGYRMDSIVKRQIKHILKCPKINKNQLIKAINTIIK